MKKSKIIALLFGISVFTVLTSCKSNTETTVSSNIQDGSIVSETDIPVDTSQELVSEISEESVTDSVIEVSEDYNDYTVLTATPLDEFLYDIVDDETAENGKVVRLLRYKNDGYGKHIILPSKVTVDGQTYKTKLGNGVFLEKHIVSLTFPEDSDFTEIPDNFCEGCKELTEVNITDKITAVGDSAFCYCNNLNWTELPKNIKKIGSQAFACTHLTGKLVITEDMEITKFSFSTCDFTEAVIEKQLTEIPEGLLQNNYNLKSVILPDTLTTIRHWAFYCTNIENIIIPKSVSIFETSVITTKEELYASRFTGVMSGYRNTAAEMYAKENNIIFAPLD